MGGLLPYSPKSEESAWKEVVPRPFSFVSDFRQNVFESTICAFNLSIPLRVIGSGANVLDLEVSIEGGEQLIAELCSAVTGDLGRDAMTTNDVFIYELGNGGGVSIFEGSSLWIFSKEVHCEDNVAVILGSNRKRTKDVDSNMVEGNW